MNAQLYKIIGEVAVKWGFIEFCIAQMTFLLINKTRKITLEGILNENSNSSPERICNKFKKQATKMNLFDKNHSIFADLKSMLEYRNNFAHAWFRGKNGGQLSIVDKRNSSNKINIDEQFKSFLGKYRKVMPILYKINTELVKKNKSL